MDPDRSERIAQGTHCMQSSLAAVPLAAGARANLSMDPVPAAADGCCWTDRHCSGHALKELPETAELPVQTDAQQSL